MMLKLGPSFLALALLTAAGAAFFHRSGAGQAAGDSPVAPLPAVGVSPTPPAFSDSMQGSDGRMQPLPPNHPAIDGRNPELAGAPDAAPALAWTLPPGWESVPSRSAMRLATYRVPGLRKGDLPVELSVTRAGGSTVDNVERWVGQFDDAAKNTRVARSVAGFPVTTVEVSGTYDDGMSNASPSGSHPGWALLGAVIETPHPFYFFKMVGPAGAVEAARPAFLRLLSSLRQPR